jgi:hypothetical protein
MPWGQQGLGIGQCDPGTRRRERAERVRVERQAVVDFERSDPTVDNAARATPQIRERVTFGAAAVLSWCDGVARAK